MPLATFLRTATSTGVLGLTRYQWLVIAAAWCGWGFDVFDALLFNLVAPNCIPTLLGLTPGSPEARGPTLFWTGMLSATLLVGWAIGGLLFGRIADRVGRQKILILTVLVYSVGTGLCAFAGDIWQLLACRALASLGIGGEWAVGAALVAEAVPDERRVEAGAVLQTASPLGLALAGFVNYQVAAVWFAGDPTTSWRYVFLFGLIPAGLALFVRLFLHETHRFEAARATSPPPLTALLSSDVRASTFSGLFMAVAAVLAWWSCTAFMPVLVTMLAQDHGAVAGLDAAGVRELAEQWKVEASNWFNLGGLLGTFLAIPIARRFGRRQVFATYFLISLVAMTATFGANLSPEARINGYFAIGLGVYGVFAAFVFYLPELFPTRLRAAGAGLTYNFGRIFAACGIFLVGVVSQRAGGSEGLLDVLTWVAIIPAIALIGSRWIVETRGRPLPP